MKKFFTFFSVICLSVVLFSCSKNDDPADNDLFVGTYKGKISYKKGDETKGADEGSVTVVKTGNDYYFRFSDGIPDLKGVTMKKGENNLIDIDFSEGVKGIRVTASELWMLYEKDGAIWEVINAKR